MNQEATGRRGLAQRTLDALITTDPHQRIRLAMAGCRRC